MFQLHPLNPKDIVKKRNEMDMEVCRELMRKPIDSGRSPSAASASNEEMRSATVVADVEPRKPRLQRKASNNEEMYFTAPLSPCPLAVAPSL